MSLDERVQRLGTLLKRADPAVLRDYRERLDVSWIYHDSALDGVVYAIPELRIALDEKVASDSSLIPAYDEIQQSKAAINLIRELAEKKRVNITLDVIKRLYCTLAPEDAEPKGPPKYRKEMPLHRLYFHDITTPDKIAPKMRQLVQWMAAAETRRSTHAVRLAAKAHYTLLQIYPFKKHSGKIARLLMNLILLHNGYPPAIIHATERQRYYEALKASPDAVAAIVTEALMASVGSTIRLLEDAAASSQRPAAP